MHILARFICILLIISCCYEAPQAKVDTEMIRKTNQVLVTGADMLKNINQIIAPIKAFAKLSQFLSVLGPAAMAISAVLTIVTIFLPAEDSPEMKAIKSGFDNVNNRLDIITSKIGNLDTVIELSSAKSVFVESMTSINSNYEALEEARKGDSKEYYQFFAKQFENTFSLATDKIYDSLMGAHGSMGFDIVNLYKIHVKCNAQLVSQFCTKGLQMIVKGLEIEGAYMGFNNFSEKAKAKSETWKNKLELLTKQCSAKIEECENNWKTYAYQQFKDSYREIGGDNQVFADRLAKELDNIVPQRSWITVVYNDAAGFGPHTFSSYYETEKIWHEKDHCATIASTTREPALTGAELSKLTQQIQIQVAKAETVNDCDTTVNWLIPANKYNGNHARFIVEKIRETYQTGFVNAVNVDYSVGIRATGNTLYVSEVKWRCTSSPFKLIIFQ